ncbi:hypothetical protein ABZ345_09105 [Lentzea sp. NPDC005914]|uniref:hypothetical protein n=1 Tax=Lentzea sp. NPDC005914 TaxID=3154572 RepID=UPI0033E3C77E
MEHPDLWAIAAEALEEHERPEVRAWLAGVVIQPGQTERLARGERDVVFLLPDRLVLVRPDPFWAGAYPKEQVASVLVVAGHVQVEVTGSDTFEFWVDAEQTPLEPFREEVEDWLRPTKSGPGLGVFALGLVLVVALLFAFGPEFEGGDDRLSTNSTCGDFMSAGLDAQVDLLKRLFGQAGRSDEATNPATLTASRKVCGENGSATLDSLIGGK